MNPIPSNIKMGTIGELLVQLRLLQYDVQAAPPLRDTGNDLIAVRAGEIKAIQVKTSKSKRNLNRRNLDREYDILALVHLYVPNQELCLDESKIYLLDHEGIKKCRSNPGCMESYILGQQIIDKFFKIKSDQMMCQR